jgi:hypothetical protein
MCIDKEDPDIVNNSKERSQKTKSKEKEEEEKNSPGDLPGSETVLDHTGPVLAVGKRVGSDQIGRRSSDRHFCSRARGVDGVIE